MKKLLCFAFITLFFSLSAFAQTEGINFQGVARNAAGEVLVSQQISLRLSVLLGSESGAVAYVETRLATTNPQGIFSLVVGDGSAISKTGNFSSIDWKTSSKFLKVEMDPNAGNNFLMMGISRMQAVPFAFYAYGVDAENVKGILPLGSGGTGVASISELKTSLAVDQINNTSDASKPISTATQAALATKANAADVTTSLATKVDKVTGKELSTNDYTTAEKTKLAAITGTNSGDQDLSGYATTSQLATKANAADVTTSLATKVDKVTGKGLSTNDYTTAEKTKLAAITGTNTGDQDLSGYATTAQLATKANTTDLTTSLATKVDKVTGKELSTNDFTTAEKTKLAAITGTNTGDQVNITGNAATATLADNISATTNTTLTSLPNLATVGTITSGTISLTTDIATTGALKAGTVTYPNTHGTSGQVLSTTGTGTLGWTSIPAPDLTNYVTTNTAQTITASKTFSSSATATNNLALGTIFSPTLTAAANNNILVGVDINPTFSNGAFTPVANYGLRVQGIHIGRGGGNSSFNLAVGSSALLKNTAGNYNVAIGNNSLSQNTVGNYNTAIGNNTLSTNTVGDFNTVIGNTANVASNNLTNATALGYGAKVSASNTIQLGADGTFGTVAITNVKTSGTLTAGTVTYPNAHNSTGGQVLTIDNAGTATWAAAAGGVPYTGATQAVDLELFDLTVNGITVGKGRGNGSTNTAIGFNALSDNEPNEDDELGINNTSTGYDALKSNTTGNANTASGYGALKFNTTGILNTAIGNNAGSSFIDYDEDYNVIDANNTTSDFSVYLGSNTKASADDAQNEVVIGYNARGAGSNTIQLGNTAVTDVKTSGNLTVNGITVGRGSGNRDYNTALGNSALLSNTTGDYNTASGHSSLASNTTGGNNTAIGYYALAYNTEGSDNIAIGLSALQSNTEGSGNTAIGNYTNVRFNNLTNATAIGYGAQVSASNTIQLGADGTTSDVNGYIPAVTDVKTSGTLTAGTVTYPNAHGGANQVLSTTGSGTLTWVTPASAGFTVEVSDEFTATGSEASFTLSNTPGANSKVKMYINGIRISNSAYSISGTTLTYDSTKNDAYTISAGDRIQFDFSY